MTEANAHNSLLAFSQSLAAPRGRPHFPEGNRGQGWRRRGILLLLRPKAKARTLSLLRKHATLLVHHQLPYLVSPLLLITLRARDRAKGTNN